MKCPACGSPVTVFRNPIPTVDIIIEIQGGIVLIERRNTPHGWALPGGFVDYGESYAQAAIREAREETGLMVTLQLQFHTYSSPDRDDRQHNASTVYIATAVGEPTGADDALRARIFTKATLPPLVFDHERILMDYYTYRETGRLPMLD